jgi:hypothetical protein
LGPVKIDLVDADGYGDTAVIEENIQPTVLTPSAGWPFKSE